MNKNEHIENVVMSYPKLAERLGKLPKDKKRCVKLIKEIKADFNEPVIKSFGTFLDLTFLKLYDGLSFKVPKDMDLKKLATENSVVFVPNHQSHADYIALTYLIYNKYQLPIYVAGGINLNIFPIGGLFRKSGCFFIRRSFNNDILYKLTLEGYLYYLLKEGKPIEFFFEGGRSRTGKLLPPRFGLFSMLLNIYNNHKEDINRPLMFIPVSIVHEYVPEGGAHTKELRGGKKEAESTSQLFKLFKLFGLKLGNIHVSLSQPLKVKKIDDIKQSTQDLAFECFRQVGKRMMVTPTSILSMVLLDDVSGALTWNQIYQSSMGILSYCRQFDVDISEKLAEGNEVKNLKHALNLLLNNKKVKIIKNEKLGRDYYSIREESRMELSYFKNTILHHFIVPSIIGSGCVRIFNGNITTMGQLKKFLIEQRRQLMYEFYLPTVKELLSLAMKILSWAVESKIDSLEDAMKLSATDLYKVASKVSYFSKSFSSIYEAYYVSSLTLKYFDKKSFGREEFLKAARELFEMEKEHGRFIKFPESYSTHLLKNSLEYFQHLGVIGREAGKYQVLYPRQLDLIIEKYTKHLVDILSLNLKMYNE